MTQPATLEPTRPVADLDRRFYAFALDRLVAWGVGLMVAAAVYPLLIADGRVATGVLVIIGSVILVDAVLAVLLGLRGTSAGMAAVGIRVLRDDDGGAIGVGRALLRQLILLLAGLPTFGLGLATLAWTALADPSGQRRGWHDHVGRSVVVDVRPVPDEEPVDEGAPRHIVNLTAMRLVPTAPPAPAPPAPPTAPPTSPTPPPTPPTPAPRSEPAARQQLGFPLVAEPTRDAEPAPVPRHVAPVPTATWRVAFDTGETLELDGLALVGRRPEARDGETVQHLVPLRSQDMSLSKTHAQLRVADDGTLVVMDRGSTNGSILVRQGVARELGAGKPATLMPGDRVRFGDREMVVAG